jgi:hypothetical protein
VRYKLSRSDRQPVDARINLGVSLIIGDGGQILQTKLHVRSSVAGQMGRA